MSATTNSQSGSVTTSIPTPTKPSGSPPKSMPSPRNGPASPQANARDAPNPRPSPDGYRLTARPPKRLFHLVLESHDGRAPGADSEEKHEPVSDIDTVVVDSLKALDPEWPIREADISQRGRHGRNVPQADIWRSLSSYSAR